MITRLPPGDSDSESLRWAYLVSSVFAASPLNDVDAQLGLGLIVKSFSTSPPPRASTPDSTWTQTPLSAHGEALPCWGSRLCPQRLHGLLQFSRPASLRCRKAPDAASLLGLPPFPLPVVWALSQADSSTSDFKFLIRLEAWEGGGDGMVPTPAA